MSSYVTLRNAELPGDLVRHGEIQIARHSHCDHDLVGLQKTGRQAALNNVKAWRTGLWRSLNQGAGDASNLCFHMMRQISGQFCISKTT